MTAPRLAVRHLRKSFGGRRVVDDVGFDVASGEIVCLLGASGSGKSTTLRMVAGIERADDGEIQLGGDVVDGLSKWTPPEKRGVGLVFQDLALFPHLTVHQNAAFGMVHRRRDEARAQIDRLLDMVRLSHLAKAYPHQLSGGEQQRLAVARALATSPQVMLLDEPFSGLDDRLRDQVRQEVLVILREQGAATLFVTHDPDEALRSADRIVLMRQGRIAQTGKPAEMLNAPIDIETAAFFSPIGRFACHAAGRQTSTPLGVIDTSGVEPGVPLILAVRPHDLEIASAGLAASIASIATASDGIHVTFDPEPGIHDGFSTVFSGETSLRPHQMVQLRLRPGRGFVFPAT